MGNLLFMKVLYGLDTERWLRVFVEKEKIREQSVWWLGKA